MTGKGQVLIIDSTGNRRKELRELWSNVLGYEVVTYGDSEFSSLSSSGRSEILAADALSKIQPLGCLFHHGDIAQYKELEVKKVVDSSQRVVMFSGVGLSGPKPEWGKNWLWIPRAITGRGSASDREWRQLADWFKAGTAGTANARSLELLSVKKRPQFLIAIYILCQGFLAAEGMRVKTTAVGQTRTREWWSVPLLKSAGPTLVNTVRQEWGEAVPDPVLRLVRWIAGESDIEDSELSKTVTDAKKELECRIAK